MPTDPRAVALARAALWGGADPFHGLPPGRFGVEIQGWNSAHRYLSDSIALIRPSLVVEIGVWKGASTLFMASKLRELAIDGVVIAVDTWLGSSEHWISPDPGHELSYERGYPRLFEQFMVNVAACGLNDHVVPLPLDSGNAAAVIGHCFPPVDMIHLDAAHDYDAVMFDLTKWWPRLRLGGLFIGDDYFEASHWPDVKRATDDFLARVPHADFAQESGKWRAIRSA